MNATASYLNYTSSRSSQFKQMCPVICFCYVADSVLFDYCFHDGSLALARDCFAYAPATSRLDCTPRPYLISWPPVLSRLPNHPTKSHWLCSRAAKSRFYWSSFSFLTIAASGKTQCNGKIIPRECSRMDVRSIKRRALWAHCYGGSLI